MVAFAGPPETAEEYKKRIASMGGKALVEKRGKKFMKKIGKKGLKTRYQKK